MSHIASTRPNPAPPKTPKNPRTFYNFEGSSKLITLLRTFLIIALAACALCSNENDDLNPDDVEII
jgi:hypothetical protein